MTSSIPHIHQVVVLTNTFLYNSLTRFLQVIAPRKTSVILHFFLLFFVYQGTAQVSFLADSLEAATGQTVNIPIKVVGFNNIFSMQFSINWDSTVLAFKEVQGFTEELPQFGQDGIGNASVTSGELIVVWFDNSLSGINLEDSTVIMIIQFQVIGEEGSESPIRFSDSPALIEIVDATSTILETVLIEGQVVVPDMSTATTYLQAQNGMRLFQNHPNPFYRNTTIKTSFEEAELVLFTITDAQGRIVHQEQFQSSRGIKNILLPKHLFPTAGIYQYTIQGRNYQLSKQLIFLP